MLVSVIVPVYNTEKYLKRCVDSILSQAYTNFELLLIDDGSTDGSLEICEQYAEKDSRVRVFHKDNGGVSSARNFGLENSLGEWVTFVDSDDRVEEAFLQTLVEKVSNKVDLVVSSASDNVCLESKDFINRILMYELPPQIWGKLYRRQVLDGALCLPRDIFWGEDLISNILVGLNLQERVFLIDKCLYCYNINETSISHSRQSSLEYEEYFLNVLQSRMGKYNVEKYENALYYTKLHALEDLIVCRQKVNYDALWIKELKDCSHGKELSFRQKIVLSIRNNLICRYALALDRRFSRFGFYRRINLKR